MSSLAVFLIRKHSQKLGVYLNKLLQPICFLFNICIDNDDLKGQAPSAANTKLIINDDRITVEEIFQGAYILNLSIGEMNALIPNILNDQNTISCLLIKIWWVEKLLWWWAAQMWGTTPFNVEVVHWILLIDFVL